MTNGEHDNKVGVLNTERKVDHKKKMPKISDLDKEVEKILGKAKKEPKLELKGQPELGDGVDFAAAGVKDLNNFKGYHNQEENKNEEAERYSDPVNGAHFEFTDLCGRLFKLVKNRDQERKIYQLTGQKE